MGWQSNGRLAANSVSLNELGGRLIQVRIHFNSFKCTLNSIAILGQRQILPNSPFPFPRLRSPTNRCFQLDSLECPHLERRASSAAVVPGFFDLPVTSSFAPRLRRCRYLNCRVRSFPCFGDLRAIPDSIAALSCRPHTARLHLRGSSRRGR